MQGIRAVKVAKYMLLPGIGPRIGGLVGSGFGYLAFLIATIYGMVRLLPPGHPYLNPQNMGRYGMRHAVAEAANHLVLSRKNLDQIIIFMAILLAIALLVIQFAFLAYFLFMGVAHAQGSPATLSSLFTGSIFNTPRPEKDVALTLLDRVFGIPGFFCNSGGACTAVNSQLPWPIHSALHNLFEFYSTAMLLVGVLIFLYFAVVVVAETATTGSPFGQRFQNVWVPIRLVVALGLLVPINYGISSGQYLMLYAAKMGSGIATNGWLRFNKVVTDGMYAANSTANPLGEDKERLVAIPRPYSIGNIVQAMSFVTACAYGEWVASVNRRDYESHPLSYHHDEFKLVKPYMVKNVRDWMENKEPTAKLMAGSGDVPTVSTYEGAVNFFDGGDIIIVFGEYKDNEEYKEYVGNVKPTCGEIRIPITSGTADQDPDEVGGSAVMQRFYLRLVKNLWNDVNLRAIAIRFGESNGVGRDAERKKRACKVSGNGLPANCLEIPGSDGSAKWKQNIIDDYQKQMNWTLKDAWKIYVDYTEDIKMTQEILDLGWGGAGVWYNKIAEINGDFLNGAIALPTLNKFPAVMEDVKRAKEMDDSSLKGCKIFEPKLSQENEDGKSIEDTLGTIETTKAANLHSVCEQWAQDGVDQSSPEKQMAENFFRSAMGMIFGLDGLMDITKENSHVHPLAQISMIGKSMVESTVRNLGLSYALAFGGGAFGIPIVGGLMSTASEFLMSTAFLGLTAGVTLYYVVPFLPFLYFFFAVGSWVKSIFEAMVGVPLWALAHLRIDGDGLPGESASNGYFLILEIGLRPILIVFGLIAALLIFTAHVRILNVIWELVVTNVAGFNKATALVADIDPGEKFSLKRDIIDQFFYSAIYTIIVYMMATSSFKLIDTIPNNILRWIGTNASSFGDKDQNPSEGLSKFVSQAGFIQGREVAEAGKGLAGGLGTTIGQAFGTGGRMPRSGS